MTFMEALAKVKEYCSKNCCETCLFVRTQENYLDENENYKCPFDNLPADWKLGYVQKRGEREIKQMTIKERLQERYDYYNHIIKEDKLSEDTSIYCKGKRDAYTEALNYLDGWQP